MRVSTKPNIVVKVGVRIRTKAIKNSDDCATSRKQLIRLWIRPRGSSNQVRLATSIVAQNRASLIA